MTARANPPGLPLAYFITFGTYGSWLHGEEKGSVDRSHNLPGTPYLEPNSARLEIEEASRQQDAYVLDEARRGHVLAAVREVCAVRQWDLFAAHVRPAHVHLVLAAGDTPEKVMNAFKCYASRRLNAARLDDRGRKRWSRHGSTRYLWHPQAIEEAVAYVVDEQGPAMAVYDRRKDGAP